MPTVLFLVEVASLVSYEWYYLHCEVLVELSPDIASGAEHIRSSHSIAWSSLPAGLLLLLEQGLVSDPIVLQIHSPLQLLDKIAFRSVAWIHAKRLIFSTLANISR